MKKLIASIVLLIMLLAVGCSEKAGSVAKEPVKLTLLALSAQEKEANIVRD